MRNFGYFLFLLIFASGCTTNNRDQSHTLNEEKPQSNDVTIVEEVVFESEGVQLSGSMYIPKDARAAVVLVHGSDPVPRMTKLAQSLAKRDLLVLTYDKRGVGESGGVYVGLSGGNQ